MEGLREVKVGILTAGLKPTPFLRPGEWSCRFRDTHKARKNSPSPRGGEGSELSEPDEGVLTLIFRSRKAD
jgi:hypothetical protein